jgi:SpoVK/Ycf46/Vps4 family AAA+-type ATPase
LSTHLGNQSINVHQPLITRYKGKNKSEVDIEWKTYSIQTNKNLKNTILSEDVEKELIDDLADFVQNEHYYNEKGIPYKRGYLLHGIPGTGKTSIIKSIANHYCMDIYLINMGDIKEVSDMIKLFQGTRNSSGYHLMCFEDIDRCEFLKEAGNRWNEQSDKLGTFINELDGVIEIPKRITFFTANNHHIITRLPALIRPGRIDKNIELGYCTTSQLNRLYNHYTRSGKKLELNKTNIEITPAQFVKHILIHPEWTPEMFMENIDILKQEIKEEEENNIIFRKQKRKNTIKTRINQKRANIKKIEKAIKSFQTEMSKIPEKIKKEKEKKIKYENELQKLLIKEEENKMNKKIKTKKNQLRLKKEKIKKQLDELNNQISATTSDNSNINSKEIDIISLNSVDKKTQLDNDILS